MIGSSFGKTEHARHFFLRGERPSSSLSRAVARRHLLSSSTIYAGMRIVLALLISARLIDCLIQ